MEPDDLLTTNQVAELAGVSRTTVWRWAEDGTLPTAVALPSGHRRFRRSDVEALLAPQPPVRRPRPRPKPKPVPA